ncbi:MAG TPA: hypothetical protein VGG20_05760, partial [Thermoanaerobaculia bacterium]
GPEVVHDVGDGGRRLLDALAAPTTLAELAKVPFDPQLDREAELARLRSLGLIFEDGDRLISLILPHEAKPERLLQRYAPLEVVPA